MTDAGSVELAVGRGLREEHLFDDGVVVAAEVVEGAEVSLFEQPGAFEGVGLSLGVYDLGDEEGVVAGGEHLDDGAFELGHTLLDQDGADEVGAFLV